MKIRIRQAPAIRPRKSWLYYALALAFTLVQALMYFSGTVRITFNTCKGWWL